MNTRKLFLIVLFSSFIGAVMAIMGYRLMVSTSHYDTISSSGNYKLSSYNLEDTSAIVIPEGLNFIYAANAVTPAVVHIKTMYEVKASSRENEMDEIFREFFGDQGPRQFKNPGGKQEASGSGVILSEDGYIVTNNHVIDNADKIEVVLNDRRSYQATLVGVDPTTDIALLKIDETGLSFVRFGNSDKVRIGEWVLAVGNPFNLTSTVTAGIVSAKARNINILRDKDNMAIESFIQTDAAVNPGNSGGALVNLRGELIGINTAIATPSGTFAGYSFAVPEKLVEKVIEDLKKYGQVQRALLGIQIQDVTAELAKEKGINRISGVYIGAVNEGSAADAGGLKEGDVVTKINDVIVNTSSELQEQVARYRPGDKIKVTYERKGDVKTADVVLKNKLGETTLSKLEPGDVKSSLGAEFRMAEKSELKKLGLTNGVQISKIRDGKLKEVGIKEGFIITSIDKRKVASPSEVASIFDNLKNGGVLIEGVYPDGQKAYYGLGM